jgi:hypothetical protein
LATCRNQRLPTNSSDESEITGSPELRVDADDASVVITGGTGSEIAARLTTKGWDIGPSGVQVTDRQSANRVEITIRMPHDWGFLGSRSARLELTVPQSLRADIRTGDGRIEARSIAGELRFVTGDGSVEADGVGGALDARTGDGSVRARGRFERLDVNTGDGSVTVAAAGGSKMAAPWRVHTGDGSVTVRLPAEFAADIDARTGDGSLNVKLPLTTSGIRTGQNAIRGRLNGGGPTLRVETGDGSIHIEPL